MGIVSTATLANGSRVEFSVGDIPRNGTYDLIGQLFDAKGALVKSFTVDTATNSDGSTAPPRGETFSNLSVVGLSGGGFAVAYDDTVANAPGGSNSIEVHVYDAAAGALGVQRLPTSSGGQPFPTAGVPQLVATSANGVILTANLGIGRPAVTLLAADGTIQATKVYDALPQSVYDAGFNDQIVVTLTKGPGGVTLETPVREVLTRSTLELVSSTSVVETHGGHGADVLTGGAFADRLFGEGGDDVLQGGASFDSLTGGAGRDKFLFAVDGSVDQVTDFDAAQDTLALVDAGGAPLNSATGILTFWRATGVLTYDPDGDQGPAAAQTVAVLPGVKTLTQANLAPGYEPAMLRIYNPITPAQVGSSPGSHSDLTFGYGKQGYVSASADYSPNGVLLTYGVNFTDGTSSMRWFDTSDVQPWENLVADYDAQGRLLIYATYDDDGSHVLWRYDPAAKETWQRIVDHFDAQGRMQSRDVVNDDGTRFTATYDVADTQPWGYAVDHFNASGAQTGHSLFNDNGTPFG